MVFQWTNLTSVKKASLSSLQPQTDLLILDTEWPSRARCPCLGAPGLILENALVRAAAVDALSKIAMRLEVAEGDGAKADAAATVGVKTAQRDVNISFEVCLNKTSLVFQYPFPRVV